MITPVRSLLLSALVLALSLFAPPTLAQSEEDGASAPPGEVAANDSLSGVLLLPPHPAHDQLTAAKLALSRGEIVEMKDESVSDFNAWLDLGLPATAVMLDTIGARDAAVNLSFSFKSNPAPTIIAARLDESGSLHGYVCQVVPRIFPQQGIERGCATGFRAWVTGEQAGAATLAFPIPEQADWTALANLQYDNSDTAGNYLRDHIRLYRLNDLDRKSDWYMVVRDPVSEPNLYHCKAGLYCGWYTRKRDFQTSLDRNLVGNGHFSLYDWSPRQANKTITNSLSLGLSPSGVAPSPSVGYSISWEQQDVDSTVYSAVSQKEVSWVEVFKDGTLFSEPPVNAKTSFISHNGAIFQVPQATSAFRVNLYTRAEFLDETGFWKYNNDITRRPVVDLTAPVLSVNLKEVAVTPRGRAVVQLTSSIPGYSQRLKWKVQSAPSWLQVSPSSSAQSGYLTFQENGTASPGTAGVVELTTDPPYAAPSVEDGPLQVRVEVVRELSSSGVLLAGGEQWDPFLPPLASAEVWDPATGSVRLTLNEMSVGRSHHTATLLANGRILLAGGLTAREFITPNSDLYDPSRQMFSPGGQLLTGGYSHTATLLPNGQVLVAGGCCDPYGKSFKSAELYDPATNRFFATGNLLAARRLHTATLLPNGKVLLTGGDAGFADTVGLRTAELYDPATRTFTPTGMMVVPRTGHTANQLDNGLVVLSGGSNATDPGDAAELYNPADGVFTRTGLTGTTAARRFHHASIKLLKGFLLQGGGTNGLTTAEFCDPTPSFFFLTRGTMAEQRNYPTAALLTNTETASDGKVLFAGGVVRNTGRSNGTLLELFDPASEFFYPAGNMTTARSNMTATYYNQAEQLADPVP